LIFLTSKKIKNHTRYLLNTLSELAAAIHNDASFSTTMTNLIATKVGLTSNNTVSGSNTFIMIIAGNLDPLIPMIVI
jgi:hypothetical protein